MKRKWLAIGIILLFVGVTIAPAIAQHTEKSQSASKGTWLYVGGSGPGNYTRIQDAINDASNGDTVFVFHGIYILSEFTISKSISLIGEDKYSTVIDGDGSNYIMRFGVDFINISGFTLQNVKYSGYTSLIEIGWHIRSNNNIIANNIFNDSRWYAINMNGADHTVVIDNFVMNCGHYLGIGIYCMAVTGNIISNNTLMGSSIEVESSTDTNIVNNHVIGSQIYVHHGDNIIVSENIIENGSNMVIEKSEDCIAEYNRLLNSGSFIIRESINCIVNKNTFNDSYGILIVGNSVNFWDTHTVANNKNNGKPIYYYKNKQDKTVPNDASQVILASCINFKIQNMSLIKSCGIQLAFSSNNFIYNNTIVGSVDSGIKLIDSPNNNISDNTINDNKKCGVASLGLSGNNTFFHNNIMNNSESGITISEGSPNNYFNNNFIQYGGEDGINLGSNFNNVVNNLITDIGHYGIFCSGSNNKISGNHIANNIDGLKLYGKLNLVSKNNFINNDRSVSFYVEYKNVTSNKWIKNYYDDVVIHSFKLIWGRVQTRFGYWGYDIMNGGYHWYWIKRIGVYFDWFPAQEPYDIPGRC